MPGARDRALAAAAAAEVDTDDLKEIAVGMLKGLAAARESTREHPPGRLRLLALLNDKDTRRGLYAMITMLKTMGAHLRPGEKPKTHIIPAGTS